MCNLQLFIHWVLLLSAVATATDELPHGLVNPGGSTAAVVAVYTTFAPLVGAPLTEWERVFKANQSYPQPTAGVVDALAHMRAHTSAWRRCRTAANKSVAVWAHMFPVVDRESDFVHMHPAQFDVNVDIYRACGIEHYLAPITMTRKASGHSVSRLEAAADLHLLLTNVVVRPDNPWFLSVIPMWSDSGSNTSFLSMRDSTATGAADPVKATLNTVRFAWQSAFTTRRTVVFVDDRVLPVGTYIDRVIALQQQNPVRYPYLPDVVFYAGSEGVPVARRTVGKHTLWVARMSLTRTRHLSSARIELDANGAIIAVTSAHVDLRDRPMIRTVPRPAHIPNTSTVFQATFVETPTPILTADPQYAAQQKVVAPFAATAIAEGDTVLCNTTAMPAAWTDDRGSYCQQGDCPMARLFAEALRWSPRLRDPTASATDIAMIVGGGFRNEWPAGPLRASYLWLVMPFYNTVCYGTLRGATIARLIALSVTGNFDTATEPTEITLLQLAGMRVAVAPTDIGHPPSNTTVVNVPDTVRLAQRQNRVVSITVFDPAANTFQPLDHGRLYTFASNSYACGAQWPYSALIAALKEDEEVRSTELAEHSVARNYLRVMHGETNTTFVAEGLAQVYSFASAASPRLFIPWKQSDCPPDTFWIESKRYCAPCPPGTSQARSGQISCEEDTLNLTIPLSIALCGVVSFFVVGIGAVLLFRRVRRTWSSRNSDRAPRDGRLAVMFLDIERGPELWGMAPRSMSAAVATYQEVVRRCIVAHGAYEVKSIGDAFLVVATTPIAAVRVACAIQVELLKEHFPTAINDVYAAFAADATAGTTYPSVSPAASAASAERSSPQRAARSTDVTPTTPPTLMTLGDFERADDPTAVDQGALWNGPRVRIGIHYGSPSVAYDAVHEGYEYHGPCVQAAAQIEAATFGGQVCVSAAVACALPPRQKHFTLDLVGYVTLPNEGPSGATPAERSHLAAFESPASATALCRSTGGSELFEVCPRELLHRRVYGRSCPDTLRPEAPVGSGASPGAVSPFSSPSEPTMRMKRSRRIGTVDGRKASRALEPVVPAVMPFVTQLFRALTPAAQDKMLDALCTAWQVPDGPPTARIAALVTRVAQATTATASALSRAPRAPTPCCTPDVSWGASASSCTSSLGPTDVFSDHGA